MKLYEIDSEIQSLIDNETGEILNVERLEELTMDREHKIEGIALYAKNLDSDIKAIRDEEAALAKRRKTKEAALERAMEYLGHILGGEKFETARCKVSFRKSEKIEIADESSLVDWLFMNDHYNAVKPSYKPIREELKKMLENGDELPGVTIISKMNVGVK